MIMKSTAQRSRVHIHFSSVLKRLFNLMYGFSTDFFSIFCVFNFQAMERCTHGELCEDDHEFCGRTRAA